MEASLNIARVVTWLLLGFTLVVVLAVPLSYFYLGEQYLSGQQEATGRLIARRVMESVINRDPEWWEYNQGRISNTLAHGLTGTDEEVRRIINLQGQTIIETGPLPSDPVSTYSFDLLDAGIRVGRLEIVFSLRPLLSQSLVLAVFMLIAGAFIVILLGIPIRALRRAEAKILRFAMTDPLTGLANRRAISNQLQTEIERARRYTTPCSVLMLDIDHFKRINDKHGHDAGDRVLIALSELMMTQVRSVDQAGRWGGEEFLIIVPETSTDGVQQMAEKLRQLVAAQDFAPYGKMTVSIGISHFRQDDDIDSLLKRADVSLYQAKRLGRNRVMG